MVTNVSSRLVVAFAFSSTLRSPTKIYIARHAVTAAAAARAGGTKRAAAGAQPARRWCAAWRGVRAECAAREFGGGAGGGVITYGRPTALEKKEACSWTPPAKAVVNPQAIYEAIHILKHEVFIFLCYITE